MSKTWNPSETLAHPAALYFNGGPDGVRTDELQIHLA